MYGKYDDTSKDGLTELKLSGKTYDNVNYILFADNSGQDNAFHRSSFSLEKTTLTLSGSSSKVPFNKEVTAICPA